jgi:hypothetical protein
MPSASANYIQSAGSGDQAQDRQHQRQAGGHQRAERQHQDRHRHGPRQQLRLHHRFLVRLVESGPHSGCAGQVDFHAGDGVSRQGVPHAPSRSDPRRPWRGRSRCGRRAKPRHRGAVRSRMRRARCGATCDPRSPAYACTAGRRSDTRTSRPPPSAPSWNSPRSCVGRRRGPVPTPSRLHPNPRPRGRARPSAQARRGPLRSRPRRRACRGNELQ